MMDSELNETRKSKIIRILLWTCGIAALATIVTIVLVFVFSNSQITGAG